MSGRKAGHRDEKGKERNGGESEAEGRERRGWDKEEKHNGADMKGVKHRRNACGYESWRDESVGPCR